jgi:hypothetical protein
LAGPSRAAGQGLAECREEADMNPGRATTDDTSAESLLTSHAFGDSRYITERMHDHYLRRLRNLSGDVPVAGDVANALERADPYTRYRIVGDTVFRCAVQHLQVGLETGIEYGMPLAQCTRLLDAAVARLTARVPGLVGPSLAHRIGPRRRYGWVWHEDVPAAFCTNAFRDLVDGHYGMTLCTPEDAELGVLTDAVALLEDILPTVTGQVLGHTHLVAIFSPTDRWAAARASSQFRLSGTVFLSRRALDNVWTAAEHLLHESLHQQLYDIRRGHTLLAPGYARADAPRTNSLWNRPDPQGGNRWDVHRTLAAFHVYVYLTLFSRAVAAETGPAAEYRARYGPVRAMPAATAAHRAAYLADQLREQGWDDLGPAGRYLVEWLEPILETLTPAPVVRGSFLHLILDRYRREASALESRGTGSDATAAELAVIADREIACTRAVLRSIGHDTQRFDAAAGVGGAPGPVERFTASRALIADTLLAACRRDYELAASREPDERVRAMVEQSSEALQALLEPTG